MRERVAELLPMTTFSDRPRPRLRRRLTFVVLVIGTIGIGLGVYLHGTALRPAARDALGDALWAVMIVWGVSAIAPATSRRVRGAVALAICWAVECSQLYHTPTLDAFRATTAGRLVLGSGFDPRDLAAYAAGVMVAVLLEAVVCRGRGPDRPTRQASLG